MVTDFGRRLQHMGESCDLLLACLFVMSIPFTVRLMALARHGIYHPMSMPISGLLPYQCHTMHLKPTVSMALCFCATLGDGVFLDLQSFHFFSAHHVRYVRPLGKGSIMRCTDCITSERQRSGRYCLSRHSWS